MGIAVFGIVMYVVETVIVSFGVAKPHKKHKHTKIRKTKISHKFKEIYNYIQFEYAGNLEKKRKELIKSIVICFILFIIAFLIYILMCNGLDIKTKNGYKILGIVFIPAVMYYIYKYKKYNEIYVKSYKDMIIKKFVEYTNNNFNYQQYGGKFLFDHYMKANFRDKEFNRFLTNDYIEGYNENGTRIEMCSVELENVNSKNELLNIVFEGIFSTTELNTYVADEIRIRKNKYIKSANDRVQMDSEEFEKYFDVYSKSDIITMEVLTHDIMEELVQFYNTYKIKFEIVIKNNNIYIRFDTGVMFKPNILKKSSDMKTLWVYYNVLEFVINFTVKINKLLKDLEI